MSTCEGEPRTTPGQGGVAPSRLPPAPPDLPACGFRNQIIGLEAAEQLSLGPPGLPSRPDPRAGTEGVGEDVAGENRDGPTPGRAPLVSDIRY